MFLSIVIPVYNADKFLTDCLDSCLRLDEHGQDVEIICVNDGSTDKSQQILTEFAKDHDNIYVILQDNGGVSAARNRGIQAAKGDWIWFVDADDLVRADALHKLSKVAANGAQLIKFGCFSFIEQLTEAEQATVDGMNCPSNYPGNGLWRNLFQRNTIIEHKLSFQEGMRYGEDLLFLAQYRMFSERCEEISDALYLYRRNEGSATGNRNPKDWLESHILGAAEMYSLYRQKPNRDNAIDTMYFLIVCTTEISMLPSAERRIRLTAMKDAGLFPQKYLSEARDCKLRATNRGGLFGWIINTLSRASTGRFGFCLLCVLQRLHKLLLILTKRR